MLLSLSPCICQCMGQCFVKIPKFLAATSNLRAEQNLVHLGGFLHFSQSHWSDLLKRDIAIKRLRTGIFVKSNTKRFTEFTNCNLSQRLVELTLLFFSMMLNGMSFPQTVPNRTSNLGKDFSLQSPEFYSCIQFEIRKRLAC